MFHCINVFSNDLYYLKDENVILIFRTENDRLHIYDVISKKEIDINSVLTKLSQKNLHEVVFHFTPDFKEIETEPRESVPDEVLFIRTNDSINFPRYFKHPITSQA
ncbi:GCN5-related N-acetyltransferase [Bacillus methanolicus PB1]|uniref:GCN5-related N-acetyltransferase n=1 Tax=Bacillus methanolicus PB1 TaxID=997296 RepID=I3DW50_BACMT|nr:GCN5-related N-acetyltransferase [Bacillus methanolicus PB1]